jgi:hypothetical protein
MFPRLGTEDVHRSTFQTRRGDELVTLFLVGLDQARSGAKDSRAAQEAADQMAELISQEPDPASLIKGLVIELAMRVDAEAGHACLDPLQYWQQHQLTRTARLATRIDRLVNLNWDDIPHDTFDAEEDRLRDTEEDDSKRDDG